MIRRALLLVLLSAMWDGTRAARIAWTQPPGVALTCLWRNATLVRCWSALPAGRVVIALGRSGPLDGNLRPRSGDVFVLTQDGQATRAALRGVVYAPLLRI